MSARGISVIVGLAALAVGLVGAPTAFATPPATTPNLLADDDTGGSSTDNVTENPRPRFRVVSDPDALVTIFEDGVALGSALADSSGIAIVGVNAINWLDPGPHCVYAIALDAASAGEASGSLCITVVDGIPPFLGNLGLVLEDDELDVSFRTTLAARATIRVLRRGRVVLTARRSLAAGRRHVSLDLPRAARRAQRLVVAVRLRSADGRSLALVRAVRR